MNLTTYIKNSLSAGLLAVCVTTMLLTGCYKKDYDDSDVMPDLQSVSQLISADANYSLLLQALNRANLATTLDGAGPFTVFAPTNAAFEAAGLNATTIATVDPALLATVLRYHVLSAAVKAKDIQRGINTATPTLNGTAFVSNFNYGTTTDGNETSYGVSINGSRVTRADIMATNGIIHAVDAVIFPAVANIVATLQANPNYSLLVAAVVRAGLAEALSGPGPFTVFAPTNEAFAAAGITQTSISTMPESELAAILRYHVINGRVYSTNFAPNFIVESPNFAGALPTDIKVLPTLLGLESNSVLELSFESNNVKLTGNNERLKDNPAQANVIFKDFATRANVGATNGVIHAIDKVLLPASANIVATLQENPEFSLLVSAVQRANLATALTGTGPFTLFAPTNEAFIDYLGIARKEKFISNETNQEKERDRTKEAIMMDAVNAINAASPAALASILTYHVTGNRLFSNNLSAGPLTTLSGGQIAISSDGGVKVKGAGNTDPAAVTKINLGTTNGIIHVIDQVLKPS
jgi:transforming growth factor-beta-induced protein